MHSIIVAFFVLLYGENGKTLSFHHFPVNLPKIIESRKKETERFKGSEIQNHKHG